MAKRLAVYTCTGCSIGEALDASKLEKIATKEYKVPVSRTHPYLCGAEGLQMIRQDLAGTGGEGALDGLVIAACSPRMKTDAFAFDPSLVVERVNLREHVAWCQKPGDEDTQMLGEDYLRMGIVRAQKTEPPDPLGEVVSKKLLVVGGGITGLTAALESAAAGYEVVLVEKEAQLGGFVATLKKRFPSDPPYTMPVSDGVAEKIKSALYNPKIQVLTSAKILKTEGQPGMFDVTVRAQAGDTTVRVGAIVLATGWKPYDASSLGHLGYGLSPNVVTNVELEKMAAQGRILRPSDRKPVQDVLFIQCAGSRDSDALPYCSSVCCMATLKHVGYVQEGNPDARVYIVYKDMRTPGQAERFYRSAQDNPLVFLTKGEVARVDRALDGRLGVTVRNTLLGEDLILNVDLVVLATGMEPNSADGEAIRALEDAQAKAVKSETESQRSEAARRA